MKPQVVLGHDNAANRHWGESVELRSTALFPQQQGVQVFETSSQCTGGTGRRLSFALKDRFYDLCGQRRDHRQDHDGAFRPHHSIVSRNQVHQRPGKMIFFFALPDDWPPVQLDVLRQDRETGVPIHFGVPSRLLPDNPV